MNKLSIGIIVFTSSLGLLAGFKSNRNELSGNESEVRSSSRNLDEMGANREIGSLSSQPKLTYPKSADTLESIIGKGKECSLADMALWSADASLPDLVEYWNFRKEVGIDSAHRRIIAHNLGRIDPYEALAYTKGTKLEKIIWREWGMHNPELALKEATALGDSEIVNKVINGIGQMQSGWLMANFDSLPKNSHKAAFRGMGSWNFNPDHLAKLDFYQGLGHGVQAFSINALAKEDPMAAYEWLVENDQLTIGRYEHGYELTRMLNGIIETNPEVLQRLIAQTPEGGVKRKMEDVFLYHLIKTDPDAAIKQANNAESPKIKAMKLGRIGWSLLDSDLEKAFQIGSEIATLEVGSLSVKVSMKGPGPNYDIDYSSFSGGEVFMKSLLVKDPSRTMDTLVSSLDSSSELYGNLSDEMAKRDVGFYVDWVNEQNDPDLVSKASDRIVSQYVKEGEFHTAAKWALNGNGRGAHRLVKQWKRRNAEDAQEWVESAEMDEGFKNELLLIIQD